MPDFIWQFEDTTSPGVVPRLIPVNTFAPVDVVNKFLWTHSKPRANDGTGRAEVPTIILRERHVKTNSFIAQILYSAGAAIETKDQLANLLNSNTSSSNTDLAAAAKVNISDLVNKAPKTIPGTAIETTTVKDAILRGLDAIQDDPSFLNEDWLKAYKGLYITELTGWTYFLPYFSNKYQTTSNQWADGANDSSGQWLLANASEWFHDFTTAVAGVAQSFNAGGSYQEKSKFYQYSKDGDSLSVSFPLINTGNATYDDVIKNWQLIYLLLFQNRPERINRNLVNPPPIYEIEIPGVRYMPLGYISSLDIEYKGARRTMKIPVLLPNKKGTITTIIPEAYQVSMTFSSLVSDSKNFMYSSVAKTNTVEVLTTLEYQATLQNLLTKTISILGN